MDALVKKFVEEGASVRKAHRMARLIRDKEGSESFDYEKECPKGEWV